MNCVLDGVQIEALQRALAEAMGELRVVRTGRDLLKEQLNQFKRQLFAARRVPTKNLLARCGV